MQRITPPSLSGHSLPVVLALVLYCRSELRITAQPHALRHVAVEQTFALLRSCKWWWGEGEITEEVVSERVGAINHSPVSSDRARSRQSVTPAHVRGSAGAFDAGSGTARATPKLTPCSRRFVQSRDRHDDDSGNKGARVRALQRNLVNQRSEMNLTDTSSRHAMNESCNHHSHFSDFSIFFLFFVFNRKI